MSLLATNKFQWYRRYYQCCFDTLYAQPYRVGLEQLHRILLGESYQALRQ